MPKSAQTILICLLIALLAIIGGVVGFRMAQRSSEIRGTPGSPVQQENPSQPNRD